MKIYIYRSSLFGILTFVLISCVSTGSITKLVEVNKSNVESVDNLNFSEFSDSCLYLKLETNQNCLIGNINDIQFSDNKIFILNSINGENEVLVFDQSGRFLNKIGSKGVGPDEYLSICSMGINSFEKNIILIDPLKNKVHKYDYSGKYMKSISVKDECEYIYKIRFISKTRMRCVSFINSRTSTLISESDEDLDNLEILDKTNFSYSGGFRFADNPISTKADYFIKPMSDIIYQYKDGELEPAFRVNLNNEYNPVQELKNGGDFSELFIGAIRKGFSPLNNISESKDFLLIQQFGHTILWDKKNKKGLNSEDASSKPTANNIPMSGCSTISGFENGFIGLLSNSFLLRMSQYYKKEKIQPSNKIEKLLHDVSLENNPSLCIYFIK